MVAVTVSVARRVAASKRPPAVSLTCALCDSPMELRRAGEDGRSETWFWGCTRFPHCRGMISAPQPAPAAASAATGPARIRARRSAGHRSLRWLALALLLITLLGIALLGSVPTLMPG